MALLKLLKLLISIIIPMNIRCNSTVTPLPSVEILYNYKLPSNIIPLYCNLTLTTTDEVPEKFSGVLAATFQLIRPSHFITLHARKNILLSDRGIWLDLGDGHKEHYHSSDYQYKDEAEIYEIGFSQELSSGKYELFLDFESEGNINLHKSDFYRTKQLKKRTRMAATYFQPIGVRQTFPCWDEPQIRVNFSLTVQINAKYIALSNMPHTDEKVLEVIKHMYKVSFKTTPAIPTYLLAFAVIDNNLPSLRDRNISMYYRDDLKESIMFAWNVTKNVTRYFNSIFKNLNSITEKLDIVIIPGFPNDSISNLGLILYREDAIICDNSSDLDINRNKVTVAHLVSRQIARQWFGNMISPSKWSDMWLYEGLARLFGAEGINKTKIFGNSQMMHLFIVQNQYEALHLDTLFDTMIKSTTLHYVIPPGILSFETISSSQIKFVLSLPPYTAISILYMWQHTLTDEAFQKGVRDYLNMYAFRSASYHEFWATIEKALNEMYYVTDTILIQNLNDWTKLHHYPVLNVRLDSNTSMWNIYHFSPKSNGPRIYKIPVSFTTQSKLDFTKTSFRDVLWLEVRDWSENQFVSVSANDTDWIIVNLQQVGYYRVNYDRDNWNNLINYLRFEEHTKIHVLNRAKLIDDAFHLVLTRQLKADIFWNLVEYLKSETDYIAWYPMIRILEYIANIFTVAYNTSVVYIRLALHSIFISLLNKIGYEEHITDNYLTRTLRVELMKWLCLLDDINCNTRIFQALKLYLENPVEHQLSPEWKEWKICTGLKMSSDKTIWEKVLDIYRNSSDPIILESLACAKDTSIIIDYLSRMMPDHNSTIRVDQITHNLIFLSIVAKNAGNIDVFLYILNNFAQIKPSDVNPIVTSIIMINNLYSIRAFEKMQEFMQAAIPDLSLQVEKKILRRQHENNQTIHNLHIIYSDASKLF